MKITKLDKEREIELIRELGELRSKFNLSDKSEENIQRGERIREVMKELGLQRCEPRKCRRPPRYHY